MLMWHRSHADISMHVRKGHLSHEHVLRLGRPVINPVAAGHGNAQVLRSAASAAVEGDCRCQVRLLNLHAPRIFQSQVLTLTDYAS